jgi:EAL domain-containing protein (putative c-di-GMP-specific phosphodiesterase class I)
VETLDERDALIACGCDLLQGYLFARPGPPFPAVAWNHDPMALQHV